MKLKILILLIFIVGCAGIPNQGNSYNKCINELGVLENVFGLQRHSVQGPNECETCRPWYSSQVASFKQKTDAYNLYYSDTCPKYESGVKTTCIKAKKDSKEYREIKKNICESIRFTYPKESNHCLNGNFETMLEDEVVFGFSEHTSGNDKEESKLNKVHWMECIFIE